ncbi:MAG: DUF3795 domain-containing protein [candidate division WOR-3 bacterium]|jgi:hypothetical protein
MDEMIAYCGLNCLSCPIYLATREENKEEQTEKRKEILRLIKKHYGLDLKLEDITDCDGCIIETGRLFSGCKNCSIRKCAIEKKIVSCAYCEEYVCGKLEEFFSKEKTAKTRLDNLREKK